MRLPTGEPIASVAALDLAPGERLLVSGPSGAGKSSLFRALAGIWPLGRGRDPLPARRARAGPAAAAVFPARHAASGHDLSDCRPRRSTTRVVREAMAAAGLGHLVERLDEEAEWSTVLSGGEQQRVGFARALIQRPAVLLLDEAVTTLEEAEARELYRMLAEQLPGRHRDLDRALRRAGRPAAPHPADDRLAGGADVRAPPALAAVPA